VLIAVAESLKSTNYSANEGDIKFTHAMKLALNFAAFAYGVHPDQTAYLESLNTPE